VVLGDHLRMGTNFSTPAHRDIYNLFIHAPHVARTDRLFTQIDLFPTILEALGASVKDHRLGIGTSVFSHEPTLAERFTDKELSDELQKQNLLYNNLWKPKR
jgi:phosphoglycerol transferase